MTNAEKFEEVFGFKIDEFPSDPCDIIDHSICNNANGCSNGGCPLYKFWEKEYVEQEPRKE